MATFLHCLPMACLMFFVGCGLDGPVPNGPQPGAPAASNPPAPNAAADHSVEKKASEASAASTPSAVKTMVQRKPAMVREKAAVGMGEKGRGYGGDMLTVPVMAMWTVKERLVLDQIHHDMEIFKELEGHAPKTQKEFMDRIVNENNLHLPALPAGQSYYYDPSTGELMVEKPNDLP